MINPIKISSLIVKLVLTLEIIPETKETNDLNITNSLR